ncbi:hypothetical protein [Clostridium sp. AM58-1XD]|uniref:hypothetical protein n=1 Tax=Clostridium sp. AM58-1XD TaxID=2292307 RepID=UPI000E518373|nr:hypothetical protein [Clostridium sp. AM58-1XD]RGZ00197.1 hypothetical protein DXA13_06240 [Clostridium sp. AM58-1XD]
MDKIKKRDMKLSDYNISRAKYNELKYFCMQYYEKRRELQSRYGLRAVISDGQPKGNLPGKPTESIAVENTILQRDIDLIERTAREADSDIYQWLMKNITEGVPYEWLDVPMNRTDFYCSRKYFFYLLSKKR